MLPDILTALLVVAIIGVIAAVVLILASHFLKVEENETVAKVRECLPGANCGACGFAGCDSYAEAVANGKAEALEFYVSTDCSVKGIPLRELKTKDDIIIASINRKGKIISPRGDDTMEIGDTVIVVTTNTRLEKLEDIRG